MSDGSVLCSADSCGIAEAALRTGVSAHTLRYYERVGLIDPVDRGDRGERRYARRDLDWIAFLQRLRATGMPIREMKQFADLRREGAPTAAPRRALLEAHRHRVCAEIERLRGGLDAINAKLARLEDGIDRDQEAV